MRKFIVYLLLSILLSVVVFPSFAQQNQNALQQEIEALKKQLSEIQTQLKTVEHVEKMELAAKLAEAQAKLAEVEFGKFERELRDSNNKWLWGWTTFFVAIVAIVITVIGLALWFFVKTLIADRVEERLNGFKDAIEHVNILEGQMKILKREHAVSVLENVDISSIPWELEIPSEQIKALSEEVLLEVFCDKTRLFPVRFNAAAVLRVKKSPLLVSPALELLNSVVDSDFDSEVGLKSVHLYHLIRFVGEIHTDEAYHGVKYLVHRLVTENPKHKGLILPDTLFSFTKLAIKMNTDDAVLILKLAVSHIENTTFDLSIIAEYFDTYNEPEGIKEILNLKKKISIHPAENKCLELLEKHDPDFVKEWKAQKETVNTENEESS